MRRLGMILLILLGVIIIASIDRWQQRIWKKNTKTELAAIAEVYQHRLETTITSRFNAIKALSALFIIHPDTLYPEFRQFAERLIQCNPPIRALQFADSQTRVTYVFPSQGNEITIVKPMILLTDPQRGPFVKKAIEEHRMTAQGPFKLRQGGLGIAVRNPIFLDYRFIGLAIGIFDVPKLIKEASKNNHHAKVEIQLSDTNSGTFYGYEHVDSNHESKNITVADLTWKLTLGWPSDLAPPIGNRILIWLLGGGIWLSFLAMLFSISEQNRRLTDTVAQRTKELTEVNQSLAREVQEQKQLQKKVLEQEIVLRHAQKMDSLGTLAGGVAHEFNNILGIILGNTELAMDETALPYPIKEHLEEIKSATLRGKEVGRQILLYINKLPTKKIPIAIGPTVEDTMKLVHSTLPKNIRIKTEILCRDEKILTNASDIHQLVMNLCTNAAHAIGNNQGSLTVILSPFTLDTTSAAHFEGLIAGEYIMLKAADTGCGIDPAHLERIFEPYFTTKDVDEGLGMGLAVVYGIVKNCNGAVRVESRPGEGTTFEILLPLFRPAAKQQNASLPTSPPESRKILLVEDEIGLLESTREMLELLGFEVTGCLKSPEALRLFRQNPHRFDLVITDMAMPDMTGDRLAQEMLALRSDLPIIMVTGHSDHMDEATAKRIGIQAYAMKPLLKAEIAEVIKSVLNQKSKSQP